jgi:nicotinamidase-related amidase
MAVTSQVEPITDAVHLSIDVQNIFARGGIWETPWMERVLPRSGDCRAAPGAHRLHQVHNADACRRPARPLAPLFPQMAPRHSR